MHLEKKLLQGLSQEILTRGSGMERQEEAGTLVTFLLDDISVTFLQEGKVNVFYGLVFEALGRDFLVMEEGELFLQEEQEGTFQVTDPKLFRALESFLAWRLKTLQEVAL